MQLPTRASLRSLAIVLALVPSSALAEAFRAGDRVRASPLSLADERYWRTCTVVEAKGGPNPYYSLRCDPQSAGEAPSSFIVGGSWVKPLQVESSAPRPATPSNATAQPPAPPREGEVRCPPSDAEAGAAAPEREFRGAIRRGFERAAAPGADGAITVNIERISIGQAHAYRPYEDPNEAKNATITPVRAAFTTCTDYRTRIVLTHRERAFACYRTPADAMACDVFAAAGLSPDTTRSLEKK